MDIVTHAAIGLVIAGAFIDRPEMALALLAGSVAPDLDVLSRLLGKRAMLLCHQTFSHSIPILTATSLLLGMVPAFGMPVALGFGLGSLLHVLMDYTNTLGVTLLWPFVGRRMQVGWVFFVDAFVMAVSCIAAATTFLWFQQHITPSVPIAFVMAILFILYWTCKGLLLRRARMTTGEGTVSILPSAWLPWQFYICSRHGQEVMVDLLDLRTGLRKQLSAHSIIDEQVASVLQPLPEWQLMRGLSPAYHAIKSETVGEEQRIFCSDLRVRNFNSTFGDLDIFVNAQGTVTQTIFHV